MNWTRMLCIGALVAGLAGCGGKSAPPPGTRIIAPGVYSACDRGNRIYFGDGGHMQIIPMGCLDGNP